MDEDLEHGEREHKYQPPGRGRRGMRAQQLRNKLGEVFGDDVKESFTVETPAPADRPVFPFAILFLAVLADILGGLELSIVAILFVKPVSIIIWLILLVWTLGKISGGLWKKALLKRLWKRYILAFVIELIPIVGGLVPATTIYVLMAHYHENKAVQGFNALLESIHNPKTIRTLMDEA